MWTTLRLRPAARRLLVALLAGGAITQLSVPSASAIPIFSETFNSVTFSSSQTQRLGVPTRAGFGSDQDWYGARFETPDGGTIASDVGVRKQGGGSPTNSTPVGVLLDDAGLLFRLSTIGLTNVALQFQWRTGKTETTDMLVVGYFVGDLIAGHPTGFLSDRTIDLRNLDHGGRDGPWNWNPLNDISNSIPPHTGNWTELLRSRSNTNWQTSSFALSAAANQAEVWIAFWLDNGGDDIALVDNITVTANPIPTPEPASLLLLGSALAGLGAAAWRNRRR